MGSPYQWAIEGDIKGCFDNIDHHGLMNRFRHRVDDAKVNRLVLAFLKADMLANDIVLRGHTGTPQGGILSPLLANIALSVIDERYERYVWPRSSPTQLHDRDRPARGPPLGDQLPDGARTVDEAVDAVYQWNDRKRVFEPRQIRLAWDVLDAGGWFRAEPAAARMPP